MYELIDTECKVQLFKKYGPYIPDAMPVYSGEVTYSPLRLVLNKHNKKYEVRWWIPGHIIDNLPELERCIHNGEQAFKEEFYDPFLKRLREAHPRSNWSIFPALYVGEAENLPSMEYAKELYEEIFKRVSMWINPIVEQYIYSPYHSGKSMRAVEKCSSLEQVIKEVVPRMAEWRKEEDSNAA